MQKLSMQLKKRESGGRGDKGKTHRRRAKKRGWLVLFSMWIAFYFYGLSKLHVAEKKLMCTCFIFLHHLFCMDPSLCNVRLRVKMHVLGVVSEVLKRSLLAKANSNFINSICTSVVISIQFLLEEGSLMFISLFTAYGQAFHWQTTAYDAIYANKLLLNLHSFKQYFSVNMGRFRRWYQFC